jgi:hypothetical protein
MFTSSARGPVLAALLAVVLILVPTAVTPASAAEPEPRIRGANAATSIPGRYIVVLTDGPAMSAQAVGARARALGATYRGAVRHVYEHALRGFSVAMSEADALRLAADPGVAFVEQDQLWRVADTQDNPPAWGVDRVDQRARPLDQTYSYDLPAATVTAYVIDSGIRITHTDLLGRARYGWNAIDGNTNAHDCEGHGTHVAGILGGTTHGVAKRAHLVAVKVLDCRGEGTGADIIEGIDWVTANAVKPAVVNLSIGNDCLPPTGCSPAEYGAVATAINAMITAGLPVVVAAGNVDQDACRDLTGRVPQAITVGATDIHDRPASYSNWGPCVDIWAPGGEGEAAEGILSLGHESDTATATYSGTSQAAPHVAGAVALVLGRPGWATRTPAQITDELVNRMATNGVVTDRPPGAGSTSRLLFTAPPPRAGGSSIAAARRTDGRLQVFGVNAAGLLFQRSQTAPGAATWMPWIPSAYVGWYSVAAQADGAGQVTLVGLRRTEQDVWRRQQVSVTPESWTAWRSFDGLLTSAAVARTAAGRPVVVGINGLGHVYQRPAAAGADTWLPWSQLDAPPPAAGAPRAIAAETNANALIEIFALTSSGQLWHRWETAPSGTTYTPWVRLDGVLGSIAVARNADGALELIGVNGAGQVLRRRAAGGTNNWSPWAPFDTPAAVGTLRSMAAETNADGRIEVIGVNTAGQVWHRRQTAAGSDTYSPWVQLDGMLRP